MKRSIVVILVLLALVVVAVAGSAYWLSQQVEKVYLASLEQGSTDFGVQLTPVNFERGWFSSQAVTRVELQPTGVSTAAGQQIPSFALKHEIYHGLLPVAWWGQGGFSLQPVQAVVRTVIARDADWDPTVTKLYGEQEPLVIVSYIALDGSSDNELVMLPLDAADLEEIKTLHFSGLQGQFQVGAAGDSIKGEAKTASLRIEGDVGSSGLLSLDNLRLSLDQRRGEIGMMVGDSSLQLEQLHIEPPDGEVQSLLLSDLEMLTIVTEQQGLLDSSFKLSLNKFVLDQQSFEAGKLHLSAQGLDGATLLQLNQWSERQAGTGSLTMSDPQEIVALLHNLVQHRPRLALETALNTPQGGVQAKIDLALQDPGQLTLVNPLALLRALEQGSADVAIPKTLLEFILTELMKQQMHAAGASTEMEDSLEKMVSFQIQLQLAQWVNNNFVRLEEDVYRTKARFQNGKLFLNETEIPLPPF